MMNAFGMSALVKKTENKLKELKRENYKKSTPELEEKIRIEEKNLLGFISLLNEAKRDSVREEVQRKRSQEELLEVIFDLKSKTIKF